MPYRTDADSGLTTILEKRGQFFVLGDLSPEAYVLAEVHHRKLIKVALPLNAINAASAREKSTRHGHPSTLHLVVGAAAAGSDACGAASACCGFNAMIYFLIFL